MEDIFVSAKSGNATAVKGLYASSVRSAFSAVSEVIPDEEPAAEIVQQAYVSALLGAQTYEEFFLLLNKRAGSACMLYHGKNISLQPIVPTGSAFDDINSMELPDALKGFEAPLADIVHEAYAKSKKNKFIARIKKGNDEKKDELKKFEELVKKYEFSGFDDYVPVKEKEPETPKTLAQKIQPEEITLSPEQLDLDKKEKQKNKKAALIAFIFSAVILVGAVCTYFITKTIIAHRAEPQTVSVQTVITEPTITKTYAPEQIHLAYWEYVNKVLLEKKPVASRERVVAYSENGNVGSEQLNGVVAYQISDINADGQDELCVVFSKVYATDTNMYHYVFEMNIFGFENGSVKPIKESYPLIEYRAYNKGIDYGLDQFKMFIKNVEKDGKHYLYAEASGKSIKICSFHYFENGNMYEAERFAFFAWDYDNTIFMQRRLDGTYEPLYLMLSHRYESNTERISSDYITTLQEYGFALSGSEVKCKSPAQFRAYFDTAFSRIGYTLTSWNLSFDSADKKDYICYLLAKTERGDMLSRKNVVKIWDFTGFDTYIKQQPKAKVTTEQKATEAAPETTMQTTTKEVTT